MTDANANPEKRLFISLITRDIGLTDAIIDLTDNTVNAAMKEMNNPFSTAADFHKVFAGTNPRIRTTIRITISNDSIVVVDDASGMDFPSARDEIFRFGHSADHSNSRDRLSVYGIGMKRALFKIGNNISIISDHKKGGFSLNLDVGKWAQKPELPWGFPIAERPKNPAKTGTKIEIKSLHPEIARRIKDGKFEDDLIEKLAKVYSYFVGRIVNIYVNNRRVDATQFELGSNFSHENFKSNGVGCSITAGLAKTSTDNFRADTAGWFVFCNFRTVIYGDKTQLTGWGSLLPLFQPKHRPFLGIVSFTAADPELLPWTTTKGSINEDNIVWQEAKAKMAASAKPIIHLLDTRYSSGGTDIAPQQLAELSGATSNVFDAAISKQRTFLLPTKAPPKEVKVQYNAKVEEIEKIRKHLSRSKLSASAIGRKTFDHYLKNEVE